RDEAMFDRVVMDIIHMSLEVSLIAHRVFPVTPLPKGKFAIGPAADRSALNTIAPIPNHTAMIARFSRSGDAINLPRMSPAARAHAGYDHEETPMRATTRQKPRARPGLRAIMNARANAARMLIAAGAGLALSAVAAIAADYPAPKEADFVAR